MSALAKPFVHTTNDISGASEPVNVELVSSIGVTNIAANQAQGNSSPVYNIDFQMSAHDNNIQTVTWRYATDTLRDADHATLIALISNAM